MVRLTGFVVLVLASAVLLAPTCFQAGSDEAAVADATATPFPDQQTPREWATVIAPLAPDAGRDDCPSSWVAYIDSQDRFSVCYPADLGAQASDGALNARTSKPIDGTELALTISWDMRPYFDFDLTPENCRLAADPLLNPQEASVISVDTVSGKAQACHVTGEVNTIIGAVPVALDDSARHGFVRFSANYTRTEEPDGRRLALQVLSTLSVILQ